MSLFLKIHCLLEMEDAHTCLLELSEDKEASFFAVFDGHGGHDVARVASQALYKAIVNNKSYRKLPRILLISIVLILSLICVCEC